MTSKRKPSKDSSDNGQSSSNRNMCKRNKGINGEKYPSVTRCEKNRTNTGSQPCQLYSSPQITQMTGNPYAYLMNTPTFPG
ncbi:hypothetical protein DPMN_130306 [Dreissena polymorpha]|uniref:Uncharacterized protein n=1 Tax=Dreissena polymorpha TaxID=45954 RepID=A0A9D4JZ28_DREPO|nr:hypothetical protein DPMN_130306 [Dreissena polymorpha]